MKNKKFNKAREYSEYLRKKNCEIDFISRIKIVYRPYICPFDLLLDEIGEGKSIYDIGCGSGMFLSLCSEYLKPQRLGGAEISTKLVENTKKLLAGYKKRKDIVKFDGSKIPSDIEEFDIITMIDVLHHIPKSMQRSFLQDLGKNMKKGSRLLIKDIDAKSNLVLFNKLHDFISAGGIGEERDPNFLKEVFDESKFSFSPIHKKRVFLFPHFFLIIKKK